MLAAVLLLVGCASNSGSAKEPVPSWARTLEAQREARTIEAAWRDGSDSERIATQPLLTRFVQVYSADPRARSMRLRQAWLRIQARDLSGAEQLIHEAAFGASGVDADVVQVLRASILARRGEPTMALAQLRSIGGRLVDGETRELWAEEAVRVANLAHADDDAVSLMVAWRAAVADEHRERAEHQIQAQLEQLSIAARLRALETLTAAAARPSAEESRQRARLWMLEAVRASLGRLADSISDGKLARRLVADAPPKYLRSAEGERLRRLAQSSDVPESVVHPAIGLLLELDDARSSRRSAELVTGAMRAISSAAKDEPVRLITRELRSFDPAEVERAVSALVSDGAALLVAGLTVRTATVTAQIAERRGIAAVLLSDPEPLTIETPFLFFVESPTRAVQRLFRGSASDARKLVELTRDDAFCKTEENLGWSPAFLSSRADVLVEADPACALRLADELRDRETYVRVWLGPEAASVADAFSEATLVSSPQLLVQTDSEPVRLWQERFQRMPSWQEAVGYDVARLGSEAIKRRGFDTLRGDAQVRAARAKIREGLASVESALMTTSAKGFHGQPRLTATLVAKRVRRASPPEGSSP